MTLISNGFAPSSVPDFQEKSYKPESPPLYENDRTRFKDSFDKAMVKGTDVPAGDEKVPHKEAKADTQDKNVESVKKLIEDRKKRLTGFKKKNSQSSEQQLSGVTKEQSELTHLSQANPEKSVQKKNVVLSDMRNVKKADAEIGPENGETEAGIEGPAVDLNETGNESLLLLNEHSDNDLPASGSDQTESSADVLIPFPVTDPGSNITVESAENGQNETGKRSSLKVKSNGSKKDKDEPTLTVIDTRSRDKGENSRSNIVSRAASVSENIEQAGKESNQIILGEQNIERTGADEAKSFESRFTENKDVLLSRELKESGNDQIVKKASFVLKDGNQGEIKLILKPESLGRVKIQLNMNENNLVGKIIVENSRVGQIFENNLNDLSRSFEEAGISSSSIEVSVGDGSKQNGEQNQSFQSDQPFFSDRLKTLDDAVPSTGRYDSENGRQLVNLVV